MAAILPARFLIRMAHRCPHVAKMPRKSGRLIDLPESARLHNFAELDGLTNFADLRLAWNELGLGLQLSVTGKTKEPIGNSDKPRSGDGLTLWLDMRDARTSHRASRYCHQFHFLPSGGGTDHDEPWFGQSKINRALQDAPLCNPSDVLFRCELLKSGYRLEAFLPAAVLTGFDPVEHPRLGIYYAIYDQELGDQVLSVGSEFPYWDDPTLWSVLELVK